MVVNSLAYNTLSNIYNEKKVLLWNRNNLQGESQEKSARFMGDIDLR